MTLKELQRWILKTGEEDSWWVAVDGQVADELMSLPDISKFKAQRATQQVSILHVSKGNDETAEWIIFEQEAPKPVVKTAAPVAKAANTFKLTNRAPVPEETPEPPAVTEEPADPRVISFQAAVGAGNPSDIVALKADVATLRKEMAQLKRDLSQFKSLVDDLKQPIMEAHELLEERERFLEIGENALFEKAQKQEVLQTELEQLREELTNREKRMAQ